MLSHRTASRPSAAAKELALAIVTFVLFAWCPIPSLRFGRALRVVGAPVGEHLGHAG